MIEVTNRDCMMRIRNVLKDESRNINEMGEILELMRNIFVHDFDWVLSEDDAYYTPIMERLGFTATHKDDKVYYELK